MALSWPRTAASIESRHRNSRTFAGEPSGHRGLPSQPGRPGRQRRTREPNQEARRRWRNNKKDNDSATARLLHANHRGTEDCRASQGDPTDSDTPQGTQPVSQAQVEKRQWQQQQQPQQQRQQEQHQQQQGRQQHQ